MYDDWKTDATLLYGQTMNHAEESPALCQTRNKTTRAPEQPFAMDRERLETLEPRSVLPERHADVSGHQRCETGTPWYGRTVIHEHSNAGAIKLPNMCTNGK